MGTFSPTQNMLRSYLGLLPGNVSLLTVDESFLMAHLFMSSSGGSAFRSVLPNQRSIWQCGAPYWDVIGCTLTRIYYLGGAVVNIEPFIRYIVSIWAKSFPIGPRGWWVAYEIIFKTDLLKFNVCYNVYVIFPSMILDIMHGLLSIWVMAFSGGALWQRYAIRYQLFCDSLYLTSIYLFIRPVVYMSYRIIDTTISGTCGYFIQ